MDEMQFGFMPGKGTIDTVLKKLYMCFVELGEGI